MPDLLTNHACVQLVAADEETQVLAAALSSSVCGAWLSAGTVDMTPDACGRTYAYERASPAGRVVELKPEPAGCSHCTLELMVGVCTPAESPYANELRGSTGV